MRGVVPHEVLQRGEHVGPRHEVTAELTRTDAVVLDLVQVPDWMEGEEVGDERRL